MAVLAVGTYLPATVVDNSRFTAAGIVSDEWIRKRTGIVQRRYADSEDDVVTMAAQAAERALAVARLSGTQIDTVIVASSTHSHLTPSAAPRVAHMINAGAAAAFDISAGCAGFCHALAVAGDLVAAGSSSYVMVVGAEKLSTHLDFADTSTAALFGDGAGAVVVGPSDQVSIGRVVWGSDGGNCDAITQAPALETYLLDRSVRRPVLTMDGPTVYRWATETLPAVTRALLDQLGGDMDDLRAFIPHQANQRIISHAIRALELPDHVAIANDGITSGNTSAASVPLAMHKMLVSGAALPGDLAALIGFGAGLSWAGQLIHLPQYA